jgi:hypothetical protein
LCSSRTESLPEVVLGRFDVDRAGLSMAAVEDECHSHPERVSRLELRVARRDSELPDRFEMRPVDEQNDGEVDEEAGGERRE